MLTPGDLNAERLPGEFFRMLLRGRGDDDAVMLGWYWYLIRCMYVITEDRCCHHLVVVVWFTFGQVCACDDRDREASDRKDSV